MAREREKNHRLAFLLASLLTTAALHAAPVPIQNASFESPTLASGEWSDTFDSWTDDSDSPDINGFPGLDSSFIEFIPNFSADGNQHLGLDLNPGVGRFGTAYQDLTTNFQPGTTYTLTVQVGRRNATHTQAGNQSIYAIETISGTVVASGSVDATAFADLTFNRAPELTYTTPSVGGPTGPIRIRLTAGGTGRSHFDDIQLDASPVTYAADDTEFVVANAGAGSVSIASSSTPFFSPANAWSTDYDPHEDKIYWSDINTGQVLRADRNGGNLETVVDLPGSLVRGIQVDSPNDAIYFIRKDADAGISNVFVSDLDGNNVHRLNPFLLDFFVRANDLALDRTNGCLFVTDSGLDLVGRFDLAPAGFQIVLGEDYGGHPVHGPWGLAVDPETNTLIVTAHDNGDVLRTDYAGNTVDTLLTSETVLRGVEYLPSPALEFDVFINDATNDTLLTLNSATRDSGTIDTPHFNNQRDLTLIALSDLDRDFLEDDWEIANFGALTVTNGLTNIDGDTGTELGEFAFGTDPNAPDSDATLAAGVTSAGDGGTFKVSIPVRTDSLLAYHLYLSDDAASWIRLGSDDYTISDSPSSIPGYTEREFSFALASGIDHLFFQVGASTR